MRVGSATGMLMLLTSALAFGCGSDSLLFQCAEDSQCVQDGVDGFCEATGACSFPDDTCASGRRYGPLSSGGLADRCVQADEDTDVGTTAPDSTSGPDGASSSTTDAPSSTSLEPSTDTGAESS